MSRKVALVMGSDNWSQAPFNTEWEIWTLSWHVPDCRKQGRVDRAYEMHRRDQWHLTAYPSQDGPPEPENFVPFLRTLDIPLYTREAYPDISASRLFPRDEIMQMLGWSVPNFASSISYCLAHAALEHVVEGKTIDTLGMWGVELLAAGEWAYQRPNANRFAGYLEGKGVRIFTPPECMLFGMPYEYGLGQEEEFDDQANAMMMESFAQYNDALIKGLQHIHRQQEREKAAAKARMEGAGTR